MASASQSPPRPLPDALLPGPPQAFPPPIPARSCCPTHLLIQGHAAGCVQALGPLGLKEQRAQSPWPNTHRPGSPPALAPPALPARGPSPPQPCPVHSRTPTHQPPLLQTHVEAPGTVGHQLPQGHPQLPQRGCPPPSPQPRVLTHTQPGSRPSQTWLSEPPPHPAPSRPKPGPHRRVLRPASWRVKP